MRDGNRFDALADVHVRRIDVRNELLKPGLEPQPVVQDQIRPGCAAQVIGGSS